MINKSNQGNMSEFKAAVIFFYDKFTNKDINHFELLGLAKTATHKETEAAYKKYSEEFSSERIAMLKDPEVKEKGEFLINRGKQAYEILIDFNKRAEYEKKGFRDISPEDVEEDVDEKARIIYKKAKTLKSMKYYDEAVRAMKEAIKLDPGKSDYYLLLGLCQSKIPEYKKEAGENLQKVVEIEPWNAEPLVALGMLFHSERLYKRAEVYYRKALELEPNHALAKTKLVEIVGPERKPLEAVQKALGKYLPSLFGKKK